LDRKEDICIDIFGRPKGRALTFWGPPWMCPAVYACKTLTRTQGAIKLNSTSG